MKDHRILTPREEVAAEDELFRAVLSLRNLEECRAFFQDLCTPAELQALKDRWAVVECLDEGLSYRQISAVTELSISNVGFLLHRAIRTRRRQLGDGVATTGRNPS